MAFVKDIETIQQFLAVNKLKWPTISPYITQAENTFLKPILGTYLTTLNNKYNAQPQTLTVLEAELVPIIQRAISNLAYQIVLPALNVQVTDSGIQIISTTTTKAAFPWQVRELAQSFEAAGNDALEDLLSFLEENKDNAALADWKNSSAYLQTKEYFIGSGREFSQYYFIRYQHLLFLKLLPVVKKTEDFDIEPHVGTDYFTALKAAIKGNVSADDKIVLSMLRPALAHLTMARAISELSVQITDRGIHVSGLKTNSANDKELSAVSRQQLQDLAISAKSDGEAYLNKLVKYLNANASVDKYATYFNSDAYEDPSASSEDINSESSKIYFAG